MINKGRDSSAIIERKISAVTFKLASQPPLINPLFARERRRRKFLPSRIVLENSSDSRCAIG